MLTLNEIRNVNFRKSNFGGYRAEDVEAFIDEVQLSYDSLLKENAELLKRLESLTSKLEEYQREEDSIRNALMNAQKVGDASLRDAKHKAEIILKDATIKAEKIVSNAQIEIHRERDVIEKMQRDIADFKARLLKAYKEHLTLINSIPNDDIMRQDTRDAVSSVPLLDRDTTAYQASRRDYPQDDYGYADQGGQDNFDRRADFQRQGGEERGYTADPRDDMNSFRDDGAAEEMFGGDRQEPVMPRERMNQSRGGFTVNIDDSMPPMQTTTLPPPMREQKKFSAFDNNPADMSRDRSFSDTQPDMGGFDRAPIAGGDMDGFGGKYPDADSLMNGGDDFRGRSFDQGRGAPREGDDRSFRRRFN
ncbi:MAG: DivIVA domain-containing protein [Clostridia bacterium]|nr:DivIVA domain-containing protein [Clostridia bacterium]